MSRPAIVCRDTTWLVSEGRDRPLSRAEMEQLSAHIAGCAMCQGAKQQFDVMFRGIDALFKDRQDDRPIPFDDR
ncbi:MAG: hypothetical protein JNM89_08750 [Hyphomicrobiaceae bacterium]|nr:hypothetical protein [Hyphomicrobiaceae bacterium]